MSAGQLVREERVARSTGSVVELIDADHPDCTDYDSAEGGRWVTACRTHGQFVQHDAWKTARGFLGHPEEWCDGCREETPDAGGPTNGGFSAEERERGRETRRRRAAERRAKADAEKEEKSEAARIEDQWTDWTVHAPMVDRIYTKTETLALEKLKDEIAVAHAAARKAKEGRRSAEAAVQNVLDLKIKSAREKKNLKRLEGEVEFLDGEVVAQEDRAKQAEVARDRLARIAFIRGAMRKRWKVFMLPSGKVELQRGDRSIRVPDDYLVAGDFSDAITDRDDDA